MDINLLRWWTCDMVEITHLSRWWIECDMVEITQGSLKNILKNHAKTSRRLPCFVSTISHSIHHHNRLISINIPPLLLVLIQYSTLLYNNQQRQGVVIFQLCQDLFCVQIQISTNQKWAQLLVHVRQFSLNFS